MITPHITAIRTQTPIAEHATTQNMMAAYVVIITGGLWAVANVKACGVKKSIMMKAWP